MCVVWRIHSSIWRSIYRQVEATHWLSSCTRCGMMPDAATFSRISASSLSSVKMANCTKQQPATVFSRKKTKHDPQPFYLLVAWRACHDYAPPSTSNVCSCGHCTGRLKIEAAVAADDEWCSRFRERLNVRTRVWLWMKFADIVEIIWGIGEITCFLRVTRQPAWLSISHWQKPPSKSFIARPLTKQAAARSIWPLNIDT